MCEEVSALKAGMANLTALMESLVAAQNQPPSVQPQLTRATVDGPAVPVSTTQVVFRIACLKVIHEEFQRTLHLKVTILVLKILQLFRLLLLLHLLWCMPLLLHLLR